MTNALNAIRRAPAIFAVPGLAVFMLAACSGDDDDASDPAGTPLILSPGGSPMMTITPADAPPVTVKPDYRQDGEAGDATRGVVSVNVEENVEGGGAGWRSQPLGSYFNSTDNEQLEFAVESRTGSIATATIRDSRLVVGGVASSGTVVVAATGAADSANAASLTFSFTVVAPQEEPVGRGNSAPAITNPEDRQYAQRETIAAFGIAVSDPDSDDAPTVTVTGLPDGLTYSSTTGQVSGTVAADAAAQDYTVTVTANDGANDPVTETFTIAVAANAPPTIASPEDRAYDRDGEAIAAFGIAVSDPDSDALTVTVTGLPDGLSYSSTTGQVSGTVAADAGARDYTVTVSASDGLGEAVTGDFTIRVWKLVEQTIAVAADNARRVQGPFSASIGSPPVNNIPQAQQVARREYNNNLPAAFDWTALAVPAATTYCAAQEVPPGPNVPDDDPAYAYRENTAATVSSTEGWAYSSNQNSYQNTWQFYARKTRTWTATCERTVRRLDE